MTERTVGFDTWDAAFDYTRERNAPVRATVNGQPYKLYPSGRALCAATRPFHTFEGEHCDCGERKSGGTIATFHLRQ